MKNLKLSLASSCSVPIPKVLSNFAHSDNFCPFAYLIIMFLASNLFISFLRLKIDNAGIASCTLPLILFEIDRLFRINLGIF